MAEVCQKCGGRRHGSSDHTMHEADAYSDLDDIPSSFSLCRDGHEWVKEDSLVPEGESCGDHLTLNEVYSSLEADSGVVPEKASECPRCYRVALRALSASSQMLTGRSLQLGFKNPVVA